MGGRRDRLPDGPEDETVWRSGHRVLLAVLMACGVVLLVVALLAGAPGAITVVAVAIPIAAGAGGYLAPGRRSGCALVTFGLLSSCVALVVLSGDADEASFSFFVAIGFVALYQHWAPLAAVVAAATLVGVVRWSPLATTVGLPASAPSPMPGLLHAGAVLLAAIGAVVLLGAIRRERTRRGHEEATSRLLLDLARRNHDLPSRQLAVLRELEAGERDTGVLTELVRLDVLAARLHRDTESLLVLSGRRPDRGGTAPATLGEVVRAGVAETHARDRVRFAVDERTRILGRAVADLAHVLAELVENAARCSPPDSVVHVAARSHGWRPGVHQIVVEDAGPGMSESEREAANRLLAGKEGVGRSSGVGLAVVSRLAAGHRIEVSLRPGSSGGLAAVVVLPESVLATPGPVPAAPAPRPTTPRLTAPAPPASAPSPEPLPATVEPVEPSRRLVHPVVVPLPRPEEPTAPDPDEDPRLMPSPRAPVDDVLQHEPYPSVPPHRRRPTRLVRPWTVPPPPTTTTTTDDR